MAVYASLEKVTINMILNNGMNYTTGEIKTVPIYLGTINPANYDPDKAMAIAQAIEPCLTKPLYHVQEVKTSILS